MNPDCTAGKHRACSGDGWDFDADVACACPCEYHVAERAADNEPNPFATLHWAWTRLVVVALYMPMVKPLMKLLRKVTK